MMAFVGWARHRYATVAYTHASIATAAVALARSGRDVQRAAMMLMGDGGPPMQRINLDQRRVPHFPDRGALGVLADLELNCLTFWAPVGWSTEWGCVGSLDADFELSDVEAIESTLALAFRPTPARKLRAVSR